MRKAVDTNILVRAMVDEGQEENEVAMRILATEQLAVSATVLLEAHWVLTSIYEASRASVSALFAALLGADNIEIEDYDATAEALTAYSAGMDFADALHVFRSVGSEVFLTFDKPLLRRSKRIATPMPLARPN